MDPLTTSKPLRGIRLASRGEREFRSRNRRTPSNPVTPCNLPLVVHLCSVPSIRASAQSQADLFFICSGTWKDSRCSVCFASRGQEMPGSKQPQVKVTTPQAIPFKFRPARRSISGVSLVSHRCSREIAPSRARSSSKAPTSALLPSLDT